MYATIALALASERTVGAADIPALARTLRAADAHFASLDFDAAAKLIEGIPTLRSATTFETAVREIVLYLVGRPGTAWARLAPYGVDVIVEAIEDDVDAVQCLRDARLLGESDDVHLFWDEIKREARRLLHDDRVDRGKLGEVLSMEYECKRLRELGIDECPKWISRRDETRGFDILSYRIVHGRKAELFVEVKSHTGSNGFHLSRKQWNVALQHRSSYVVQLWDLRSNSERIIVVDDLEQYMPVEHPAKIAVWESIYVAVPQAKKSS